MKKLYDDIDIVDDNSKNNKYGGFYYFFGYL